MSIQPDECLLHYRIVDKLGEGGMGVVWRATDTTLDRDVAIKVLPEALAADRDRLARFEREAKLLASLNHPGIAAVYGLHEQAPSTGSGQAPSTGSGQATRFIVMELVQGEDLSTLLQRGPLAPDQAQAFAQQIAEALEVAHEQGVIHRDLKPANIKITPEGKVKVLDFGLAKAFEPDPTSSNVAPTMSPTLTSAGTVAGMILGTAAYMSPEQARGHAVDKRSDIWAFGCVLYEMLTGKLAFPGDTISDTLASVLKLEPDWEALPEDTPPLARRLLERCLAKDARKRLRDIGEARIRIDRSLSGETVKLPADATPPVGEAAPPRKTSRLPWAVTALALLAAVVALLLPRLLDRTVPPPVMRFEVDLAEGLDPSSAGSAIVLSPDGERIAYLAGEPRQIYVRQIGQFEGIALSGTENASQPFFSPDGQWIGFFSGNDMKKVSIFGGASMTLCQVQSHRGASWNTNGTIIYTPHVTSGLFRVSDAGGEPEQLTSPDEEENIRSHRWPHLLPDGNAVLFTVQPDGSSFDEARIEVMDLATGKRNVVAPGGSYPRYVPTGHVTYVHEATLFAVPFDAETLQATGSPVPVVERVSYDVRNGGAQLDFSPQGHLIYLTGGVVSTERTVVWIEPDGTTTPLLEELRDYSVPRLSPDETRLALEFGSTTPEEDIWVHDLERGAMTRLTFADVVDLAPVWSPDGTRIAFCSLRDASVPNLHWKLADGSGEAERLTDSKQAQFANDFSPDGKYLVFKEEGAKTNWDLYTLRVEDREIELYLQTDFDESNAVFSPDGRWIAYDSDESGRYETYVRPFPRGGGKWQISNNGGGNPLWSADGTRLYYSSETKLMVVDVSSSGSTFRAGAPRVALEGKLPRPGFHRQYDMTRDGRIITVMSRDEQTGEPARTMLVLNWFEELRDRAR